jgi:hypothetical protein
LLQAQLAEVEGALASATGASPSALAAVASSILGQPVGPDDAQAALTLKRTSLTSAITAYSGSSTTVAEAELEPDTLRLLDVARGLRAVKDESYIRLANADVAALSAESHMDASYSSSGGLSGSLVGRVAVALVVTIVFGLIAIYTLEWLSQARSSEDAA